MKALFLVDNIMCMAMIAPIIEVLPLDWECLFVNYDGWTKRSRAKVDDYAYELGVRCRLLKKQNKQDVGEILDKEKPSVIVFTREETTVAEHLFVVMGNERGIPTLLIPHGALMPDIVMMKLGESSSKLFRIHHLLWLAGQAYNRWRRGKAPLSRLIQTGLFRIRTDFHDNKTLSRYDRFAKIATYGETMKDIFLTRQVKPESIVITGSAKFDPYAKKFDYKPSANTKRILLLTDYFVDFGIWSVKQRAEYVMAVYRLTHLALDTELVIKIHPAVEEKRDYAKIVSNLTLNSPRICQEESLPELINECNLAVTTTTTAGLEVMAAGKPLVVYNPYGDATIYDEPSGAYITHSEDELRRIVGRLFREGMDKEHIEMAEKFVYNHTYIQDGRASERIAELITQMAMEAI